MKKLLVLVPLALVYQAHGLTCDIYNQTRSKISVKLDIAAAPDRDIIIAPESHHHEVLDGLQTISYLRAIEVIGLDEPLASLGRKVHAIQGFKVGLTKSFYIGHKDPEYVAGSVMVAGSTTPRLPIRPGSGEIVVEER